MSKQARVFSSLHLPQAEIVHQILALEGISAEIRNESTIKLAGGVPFDQCYVEVWVDVEQLEEALGVIADSRTSDEQSETECPECGSRLGIQFAVCWNCGSTQTELDPTEVPTRERAPSAGRAFQPIGRYFIWALAALFLVAAVWWFLDRTVRGEPEFRDFVERETE